VQASFLIVFTFRGLRVADVSSMVFRGTTVEMMLITVDTKQFLAEAANAVFGLPTWHSFDSKRRSGNVLPLAGRYAS
jgi:hypothetical protein